MCKYFRKGRKVIWGEFDLWIPLQFVPCLFQETNIVFLLANFSSLNFDDGTPLMSKSRLQNYLWPFWRLQAVCSVLCFWVKQRTRLGSYIFMLKFNKFSRKTDRHSGINALQTFNKNKSTPFLSPHFMHSLPDPKGQIYHPGHIFCCLAWPLLIVHKTNANKDKACNSRRQEQK